MPASTGTSTTEFLGLHPSGVRNEQCSVIRNEFLLQFHCAVRVDVFGVVGDDGLGDGLSDRVHLRGVSSTLYPHTDVKHGECVLASNKDGLVHLETQHLGLDEVDGGAIYTDKPTAFLGVRDGGCGLQFTVRFVVAVDVINVQPTFFFPNVWTAFVVDAIFMLMSRG